MHRLIDKIIIHALSVFAMCYIMHGNTFLVLLYLSIILSGLNYYLINRENSSLSMKPGNVKEWIAFILEILTAAISLFFPPAVTLLPIVMYDSVRSRNYIAAVISVMGIINSFLSLDVSSVILLYVITILFLSIILSIYTEKQDILQKQYRRLRDDSEEKNALLSSKNSELLQARDVEIHNAQLSERNRIAREIHDNVGHTLSRAILQMGALLAIHKEEPVHGQLEEVRQTLDSAMNNIRSSVHDLHDDSIDVKVSIAQMAQPLKENFNLNMEIDISDNMPRPVKYAIIGITKEGISNIIKHSSNSDVIISLNEHPSMYQLIIHDYNSSGSETNNEVKNDVKNEIGMGLENIRSRVESVNGTLTISEENGFRIFVTIPK